MKLRNFLAMATITCAAFQAHAERWVNVGTASTKEYGNTVIYVDTDSAVRTGDLAKIKFKGLVESKIEEVEFECKKNLIISKFGDQFTIDTELVGKQGTVTWPVSLMKNMQSQACKRAYEFWK